MPLRLQGTVSGYTELVANGTAGNNQVTLPAAAGTLALTSSPTFTGTTTVATLNTASGTNLTIQSNSVNSMLIENNGRVSIRGSSYQDIYSLGTVSSTQTIDLSQYGNFSMTLGASITLANPSNPTAGQSGIIYVAQDATGSRTMSFGTYWRFPANAAPALTTTASAVDAIVYTVRNTTSITCQLIANIG